MDNQNVYMPSGIGELTNLQTMHMIKVGGDSTSCGIADLVNLDKLKGELCISGMEIVSVAQINVEATIKDKYELLKLILHWSCIDSMFADEASSVLDSLQPHSALEELIIWGFSGVRFPVWLGNQYMFRLSNLELKAYPNCKELPSVGQLPYLKHLSINSLTSIKYVRRMFSSCDGTNCRDCGSSTSRAFPMLETLKFTNMDSSEKWDEIEPADFPRFQHLTIIRCNKLGSYPSLKHCADKKFLRLKKEQLHKISGCQTLPFQNRFVQDGQKSWAFLRGARRILECNCNIVACTDLTFGQINVRRSEDEISKDVSFHAGQPEDIELVSCEPVWVRMGQLEEIELVCID